MKFFNLKYDLTDQKYISMIICEIGNIPPHSVPVVIKEITNIDENEAFSSESESSSSEDESENDPFV